MRRVLDAAPQLDRRLRFVGVFLERGFEHDERAGEIEQRRDRTRGFGALEAGRADLARERDLRREPHPGEPTLLHRERDERAVLHDLTVDLAARPTPSARGACAPRA